VTGKSATLPYFLGVKTLSIVVLAGSLLVGCHKNQDAQGPMERAGKHVDNAADKTKEGLKTAAEKTDEAAHKAVQATGEALGKAGDKLSGSPSATPNEPKPTSK
jgi:hypothetical protein